MSREARCLTLWSTVMNSTNTRHGKVMVLVALSEAGVAGARSCREMDGVSKWHLREYGGALLQRNARRHSAPCQWRLDAL
eukprot:scaffold310701_cov31-Attheya_sp.AAC.1